MGNIWWQLKCFSQHCYRNIIFFLDNHMYRAVAKITKNNSHSTYTSRCLKEHEKVWQRSSECTKQSEVTQGMCCFPRCQTELFLNDFSALFELSRIHSCVFWRMLTLLLFGESKRSPTGSHSKGIHDEVSKQNTCLIKARNLIKLYKSRKLECIKFTT